MSELSEGRKLIVFARTGESRDSWSHHSARGTNCVVVAYAIVVDESSALSIAEPERTIRAQICTPCRVLSESETDSTDRSPTSAAAYGYGYPQFW